jgi:hypothetical protein
MLSTGLGPAFLCLRIAAGPTRASNRPSPLAFSPEPRAAPPCSLTCGTRESATASYLLRVLVSLRERTHRSAPDPPYPLVPSPLHPRQLARHQAASRRRFDRASPRGEARAARPTGWRARQGRRVHADPGATAGKRERTPLPLFPWHPRREARGRGRHLARDGGGPGATWAFPPRDSAAQVQKEGRG